MIVLNMFGVLIGLELLTKYIGTICGQNLRSFTCRFGSSFALSSLKPVLPLLNFTVVGLCINSTQIAKTKVAEKDVTDVYIK